MGTGAITLAESLTCVLRACSLVRPGQELGGRGQAESKLLRSTR